MESLFVDDSIDIVNIIKRDYLTPINVPFMANEKKKFSCRPKFSGRIAEEMKAFAIELFDTGDIERADISKMLSLAYRQLRTAPAFFVPDTRHKIIFLANKKFGGSADKAVSAALDHYIEHLKKEGST